MFFHSQQSFLLTMTAIFYLKMIKIQQFLFVFDKIDSKNDLLTKIHERGPTYVIK